MSMTMDPEAWSLRLERLGSVRPAVARKAPRSPLGHRIRIARGELERKVADLEGPSTAPSTATPRASIYDSRAISYPF